MPVPALNLPTALTWARIALIPVFVVLFYLPESWLSAPVRAFWVVAVFILAAVTDWLDGWLARKLQQTSAFGAFLDPVADKLMVATALIMLVEAGRVAALVAVVIIGREITISALREWMAKEGRSASVAVATIGKLKTTAQMIALPILLYGLPVFGLDLQPLGTVLIYLAMVLTLWSMCYYLYQAMRASGHDARA